MPVKGAASPDDPALAGYWAERRKKVKPPLDSYTLRLLTRQDGTCPLCGDPLLHADQPPQSPEQWEQWWLHVTRKAIAASYLPITGSPARRTMTGEGPQSFRTGDPIGFSPERDGIKCRESRKTTLLNLRSKLLRGW